MNKPDRHPADIKGALEKRGLSLAELARRHGYTHIQRVLTSPWLAVERIVADALGEPPEAIWPSRYLVDRSRAAKLTRNTKVKSKVKALRTRRVNG